MRTRIAALLIACVLPSGAPRVSAQAGAGKDAQPAPRPLAITRVTVVDVIDGRSMPDMTVLAEGGRLLDRQALDGMLEKVAAANGRK
jgi:hypothetical protein